MRYLNDLCICINVIFFCNGCLPNPSVEPGPVIIIGEMMEPMCEPNPCSTLSGALITVSSAMADASCVYTATATCDRANVDIEYNGGGPTFASPMILTCDTITSQYTYTDGGGMQQQITSIQCVCDPNPCGALSGTLVTVSTPTADINCVYTATATCDVTNANVEYNGAGPTFASPETLTCDTGTSQYTYTDGGGMQQQIMSLQCVCNPNPCPAVGGAMVTVSAPTVDANCVYTTTATCTIANSNVEYNGVGPTFASPETLTCDTTIPRYTYTDGGGLQQQITSIQCVCDPNPCGTFSATPEVIILIPPTADANCIYRARINCMGPGMDDIQYGPGMETSPGIDDVVCDNAIMQWEHTDFFTMVTTSFTSVQCIP